MWQIAALSGRLQLGDQFWHTEDVDDPPEIVGEHMKTHLAPNIRQSFHDEVRRTHAVLDGGIGMFHDRLSPKLRRPFSSTIHLASVVFASASTISLSIVEIVVARSPIQR